MRDEKQEKNSGVSADRNRHTVSHSCGKEAESDMQKVHLGVAYYDQRDTFLNEMIAEMKVRMKEYETEDLEMMMSIREAAGIQKTQNDQVKELIDAGV